MFYRKASSFTHPKILLHAECTNLRSCDRDVTSFLFTSIHYGNTFFSRILKMSLTITTRRTGETNHFM